MEERTSGCSAHPNRFQPSRVAALGMFSSLACLACFLPLSSGLKTPFYSVQLIKTGTQAAGIKATNISPASARVQQVKPLDNRDGISHMNWISPRNSAWLTREQGQELGVLFPPTLLLTLDLGSVITAPDADSAWGIWGWPSSRKENYFVISL